MAVRIHHTTQSNKTLIRDYAVAKDEDLMILAQHEDGKAFDMLMSRHTGLVWKLVKQYMGSLNDVDDIYQDICLTVWQKKNSWKPDIAKFSTWLYRIVTNRCIDLIRARKPQHHDDSLFDDLESDIQRADDMILNKEIASTLKSCLSELPSQQQRALMMMYYDDHSISNICDRMMLSEDSVRSLLKRGKQKLRQIIPSESHYLTA
jgi:RNA polymerase sigma-70 factor (ECF subfamily)